MTTNHRAGTTAEPSDATVVMGRVLDTPATVDEGLAAELAAAAPRRWWNRGTVVLATALLAGCAFLAGAFTQQRYGQPADGQQSTRGAAAGARTGQFPGMYGSGGSVPGAGQQGQNGTAPGGAAASAGPQTTTGTVKLVDGKTVYLETSDGQVITIRTTDSTVVRTAKKAKLTDLDAGDTLTVQGTTGDDNSLTATTVTTQTD